MIDAGFEQWFDYRGNVVQNRVATFEHSGPSYEGVNYTKYGVTNTSLPFGVAKYLSPGRKAAHWSHWITSPDFSSIRFILHRRDPGSKF